VNAQQKGGARIVTSSLNDMGSAQIKSAAYMERVIILAILLALLVAHLFVVHKVAFLGFYYLPVLLAGYFCGKRTALLSSILAVLLVALYSLAEPGRMSPEIARQQKNLERTPSASPARHDVADSIGKEKFKLHFSLAAWGSFLILSAIASSILYERKQRRVEELRRSYIGVVEILGKYLELADRSSAGCSKEVAKHAVATAKRMNLAEETVENIRIAALLHDLGHKEISALILEKSAELGKDAEAKIRAHSISGKEVLCSISAVLEDVTPIVDGYHEYFAGGKEEPAPGAVRIGAEIIAVARAYYDMITGTPSRKAKSPPEALTEIRSGEGKQFSVGVVEAFEKALQDTEEEAKGEETA